MQVKKHSIKSRKLTINKGNILLHKINGKLKNTTVKATIQNFKDLKKYKNLYYF